MTERSTDPGHPAGWCIHFRSMGQHDTCEAGIAYDRFRVKPMAAPCFLDAKGRTKPGSLPCERLRRPTAEEITTHEARANARLENTLAVMAAIAPWRKKHKGEGAREVIKCPACKGRLHLSMAATNGHVHALCETEGCASWVE